MERHEIEAFLTLAEELHFGRTAERLRISPGRVSQTIKKLERRIGVPLFERTSRHVALTTVGEQFRDDLLPAHRQVHTAVARATAAGRAASTVLRVGFSAAWSGNLIVRAGDAFGRRRPGCTVQLQEIALRDPFGPLRAGELDIQLSELPVQEPDITTGPTIFHEPRALAVPAGHPLARRSSVSLNDLRDIPLITVAGPPDYWLEHHYPLHTPAGRIVPRGPVSIAWQEILSLISAGKGASPTSAKAASYYGRPDIVYVPFRDAPSVDYALLWLTARESPTLCDFVQTVVKVAASGDHP